MSTTATAVTPERCLSQAIALSMSALAGYTASTVRCAARTTVGVRCSASTARTVHTYVPALRWQTNEVLESAPDRTA